MESLNKSFTFHGKHKVAMRKVHLHLTSSLAKNFPAQPGPGSYDETNYLNKTGVYYNSKFISSGAQNFGRGNRDFLKIKEKAPGPGKYNPKVNISLDGKYYVSTYKNSLVRKFGNPTTRTSVDNSTADRSFATTPGPGSYRVYSEFGKYSLA